MGRTKRLFVVCTIVVLCASFFADPAVAACWDYTRAERVFARRINKARASHGMRRLQLDPQLSRVSRYHTGEMIRRRDLFHTSLSTLGWRVTRWVVLAENIGYARSGRRIFRMMMNSSAHRANILLPGVRFVGVGARRRSGKLWLTTTLEGRRDPGTRLSMPRC